MHAHALAATLIGRRRLRAAQMVWQRAEMWHTAFRGTSTPLPPSCLPHTQRRRAVLFPWFKHVTIGLCRSAVASSSSSSLRTAA